MRTYRAPTKASEEVLCLETSNEVPAAVPQNMLCHVLNIWNRVEKLIEARNGVACAIVNRRICLKCFGMKCAGHQGFRYIRLSKR